MAIETFKEHELRLPNNFEPLRNNRWVLQLEGIDSFLVKTVEGPKLQAGSPPQLTVALHNVIGSQQNESLIEWLNSEEDRSGTIKHLDSIGTVVKQWKFDACPTKIWFSKLDYADSGLLTTYVVFDLDEFKVAD